MSVAIETIEGLLVLTKKLGVNVTNVDELRALLMTINANYNPQAARTRMAKLVAVSVPCTLAAIAGLVSLVLTETGRGLVGASFVGALAVVWGACALVSVTALVFSFIVLGRGSHAAADKTPMGKSASLDERVMSALGRDLSV